MKHNKQHDARAASLVRIGKSLRVRATNARRIGEAPLYAKLLKDIAAEFSAEAKLLRSMR